MNKLIDHLIQLLQDLKNMDRAKLKREFREIVYHTNKQFFSQIPGISAIAGIVVGSWVASTFTNSPIKGFLSSVGIMKGGTHVVSTTTYRFLSVVLPVLAMAVTAYLVQKLMKSYREQRLEKNKAFVAQLGPGIQSALQAKLAILDQAREAGLVSDSEYRTKVSNLYQSYSRSSHSKIEEIIFRKLES